MLKLLGWVLKVGLFATAVLIAGNWIHVGGKTISDQVKTQISHAERSEIAGQVSKKIQAIARKGAEAIQPQLPSSEEIPATERQKLRALIHDLNAAY